MASSFASELLDFDLNDTIFDYFAADADDANYHSDSSSNRGSGGSMSDCDSLSSRGKRKTEVSSRRVHNSTSAASKRIRCEPTKDKEKDKDNKKQLSKMIIDAFNTGNLRHLANCLNTFCTQDCIFIESFIGINNSFGPDYREIHGIDAIFEYLSTLITLMPDAVFDLHETRVRPRPKAGDNVLVTRYTFTGTKLFDFAVSQQGVALPNAATIKSESKMEKIKRCLLACPIENAGKLIVKASPMRDFYQKAKPDIKLLGTLSMPLNDDDKITKMEFMYTNATDNFE